MSTPIVRITRDGPAILLLVNGKLVLEMPNWKAADAIANGIKAKAREAEEMSKVENIARDDAILLRSGIPLGLAHNPIVREESEKMAAWDSDLRRYIPGGIKSDEHVGT